MANLAMHWTILILALIGVKAATAADEKDGKQGNYSGTYLIIAPRSIRPNLPYSVSVNILDASQPMVIDMSILDDKNKSVAHAQGLSGRDFKAGQAQTVSFDVLPSTISPESRYRLHAKGQHATSGKVIFEQEQDLQPQEKSRSVFIQTDKGIYKPGAKVHFRVIAVKPDLKAYSGTADVKVTDPNENVVKQFNGQKFDGGVIGKEDALSMQLTEEPPLGTWKITVDIAGQITEKTFTVDKYVLPKFEVSIQTPSYLKFEDDIEVTLVAKYTYGKGVPGSAKVNAEIPYWYFPRPMDEQEFVPGRPPAPPPPEPKNPSMTKTVDLDKSGETKIRFTHAELVENKMFPNLTNQQWTTQYSYNFAATVTEKFTGTERTANGYMTMYKHAEEIKFTKQSDNFKPGLAYNLSIAVVTRDDKPLKNAKGIVFMRVYYQFPYVPPPPVTTTTLATTTSNSTVGSNATAKKPPMHVDIMPFVPPPPPTEEIVEKNLTLDSEGTVQVTLTPPANSTSMRVEAHYGGYPSEVSDRIYVDATKSPTHSYLILLAKTPTVKAGDNVAFTVRTTTDVDAVTIQIMSKGAIVLSKQMKLSSGQTGEISFASTNDMSPKSRIIAYAIRPDNKEILVDAMDFRVEGLFQNNVSIDVTPKRVEPNETVSFKVKAAPKSYVGLLAVDQSVLLLSSGNDITADEVEGDIAGYDSGSYYHPWGPFGRAKRSTWCRWCWWNVGGEDATRVFENSGVLVFTDAFLYREPPPPEIEDEEKMTEAPPESAGEGAGGAVADNNRESPGAEKGKVAANPPGPASPEPTVRKNFPETWIWVDAVTKADGTVVYQTNAPDTITSWITSAFAISDTAGLGVAPEPVKLEVFRPFFIRVDLPYSVKRGEKLALQVLAFNYLEEDQKVTVTMDHNDKSGFDFIEKPGLIKEKKSQKRLNERIMTVPGGGGSSITYFPIVPTIVGEIKILVTAIGSTSSDAVELPLIIEAEGYPVYKTKPFVMEFSKSSNKLTKSVTLEIPKDAVEGSPRAEFAVNGDIMAPVLNNIEQLVQMPYGCGEQNMLTFVPDIVVTQYLKTTQRLKPEFEEKAKGFMEAGYQRELTYQRNDNSYSAFGQSDETGSTWLTAFVTRAFKAAKSFIFIDEKKLQAGIEYLKAQQKDNGVFEEHGMIHHKAMQGGASKGGVGLTAYIMLALLENDQTNPKALSFLESSLDRLKNDSYVLAITTYALHLAKSSKKDEAFKMLESLANEKDGLKHWEYIVKDDENVKQPWWYEPPRPVDVETTAYALLTYVFRGNTEGALPLVRWLASKRNAYGGFSSTQDTVVALQALSAYASKVFSKDTEVSLSVKNGDTTATFKIDPTNSIVLQSVLLKNLDKPIEIEGTGKGIAYSQINYHYNMPKRNDPQPFICQKAVNQDSQNEITVNLCCKYALTGTSNMVVAEVYAPSGFVVEEYKLRDLTQIKDLQRVETAKGGTLANIYINSLGPNPLCFNVTSERSFQVTDQKPAVINVYDYYDPGRRIEFEYSITKAMTLEDVCGDQCWAEDEAKADVKADSKTSPAPKGKASSTAPPPTTPKDKKSGKKP